MVICDGMERVEYERLARELAVPCYRMLGRFEGRSSLRTWLRRIAANVCIDMLRKQSRRTVPMDCSRRRAQRVPRSRR